MSTRQASTLAEPIIESVAELAEQFPVPAARLIERQEVVA